MADSKRNSAQNGQRRLAVTLTVGSVAASLIGAQLIAVTTDLSEAATEPITPIIESAAETDREPYTLDLQPIPTIAFTERDSSELLDSGFNLELEPVPTVSADRPEVPVITKSKSSK